MDFKVTVLVAVLVVGARGHFPQSDDPVGFPSDVGDHDPFGLMEMGFSATTNIPGYNADIIQTEFENKMADQISPDLRDIIQSQMEFEALGTVELEPERRPDVDGTKDSLDLFGFYQHTCPYRYTFLPQWRFSYRYNGRYCWNIYPIWYTVCGSRMCNLSFTYPWWWWNYYRCFPDYRYIYAHFWCASVQTRDTTTVTWDSQISYLKVWVSRGCSCRKYWKWFYVGSAQCPAQCLGN